MFRSSALAGLTVGLFAVAAWAEPAPPLPAGQKWFHTMLNLLDAQRLDKTIELMERAAKAGYNGIVVNDVKLIKYHVQPPEYAANLRKLREACTRLKMQCVVGVMPMGYAENILAHDPNLAEGMPVRDALFVVQGGKLAPAETVTLKNPSFEDFQDNQPAGWTLDAPGKSGFVDTQTAGEGKASVRIEDIATKGEAGRGRVYQKLQVKPWQYYHVAVKVKTQDCEHKDIRVMALGNIVLDWQPTPLEKTADWTLVHMTFNSLDNREVTLYLGAWGGKTGKLWFDDVTIEPGGFVNIIRRESLPLKITSLDGKTVYVEGKDFAPVADPLLANDPRPGYFTRWHKAPAVAIPAGSALKEGDRVLASYNHALTCGKDFQINCCMSEPKLYEVLEKNIVWIKANLQPDAYFMAHDEIRHAGWDDTCVATGKTCGQILADNVARCTAIIEKVDAGKPIVVWSDMFDAHHNARQKTPDGAVFRMYLAKGEGPWYESWLGLPRQVGVVNWNNGNTDSAAFFSQRGHQQILSDVNPDRIAKWLAASGANAGVVGVMYTTWTGDWGPNFEKYVEAVTAWEAAGGKFGAAK